MRIVLVAALALLASLSGLSVAQELDEAFQPEWIVRPSARDFERHYPTSALRRGYSGTATLCCIPRADGRLDCQSRFEIPADMGFGDAALAIAQNFRMSPDSLARFQATPGAWLQVPITFRQYRAGRDFDDAIQRIREQTRNLCRPAAAEALAEPAGPGAPVPTEAP